MRGLVSWGAVALFGAGADGRLGYLQQTAPNDRFGAWESLGVTIQGAPTAAQNFDGRVEVFAVDADGRLGHMAQLFAGVESEWSDWEHLDVVLTGDPAVVQDARGSLHLFASGPTGRLGHTWQSEAGADRWEAWTELGPEIEGVPSPYPNADGRLEVFYRDGEGRLGHLWQYDARGAYGWSNWGSFGHQIQSSPVACQTVNEALEVFAIGADGCLGHVWQHEPGGGTGWSDWGSFGHQLRSAPAVFQNADGRLEVFAIGADGCLGHVWQHPPESEWGWSEWGSFGKAISATPTLFPNADGCLAAFALDADGRLGQVRQLDRGGAHGWTAWEELDAPAWLGRLAACQTGGRVDVQLGALAQVQLRARSAWPQSESAVARADVCVIGGGPAGITLSRSLIDAGAEVILLESGLWGDSEAAQELNHGDAYGPILKNYLRYLRRGRSRQVQGAAAGWGKGWCMPFRRIDYEHRPWVGHSGWPIDPDQLTIYEEQAAATFGFDQFLEPEPDGPLTRLAYRYPPDPSVFRGTFLNLLTQERFRAELGTTATALVSNGDRIVSARAARQAGDELRVEAGTFVLAAGGIENARLLLLNEDSLPAPLPMTGRFFMEHPHCSAGNVNFPDGEALRTYLNGSEQQLDVLSLTESAQREERLLNASVQLRTYEDLVYAGGPVSCELFVRAEQAPNPDSRVALTERLDRLGCAAPILHWELLDQDWTSIVQSAELVAFTLEKFHGAEVSLAIHEDAPWPWPPAAPNESSQNTWGFHHMGTTRMGSDPTDGVVDSNSRVHGTANLFVAGSSVFPTGSCANPTFQIVVLAHRLAEHLSAAA